MLNFCGIVVAILKMETGRNFTMSGINSGRLNRPMLNLWGIVAAILKMATGRNFSMPGIISRHHNLPTYEIGQCWICAVLWWPFWKWRPVEICQCRDIIIYPHIKSWWYRTMLNFCGIVAAILKMLTGRNFLMSGINSGHHNLPTYEIGQWWICVVLWWPFWKWRPVEIFLSAINSRHHSLPTYEMALKSDNVEFVQYCGGHFENGNR